MKKVFFVGAGPGDPDLITVKGMDLVRNADVLVYAGSLVNPALVERSSAGLKLDSQKMRLSVIADTLIAAAAEGKNVVRLHSGDPSLYGAIVEQIDLLRKAGIDVEIVPGVSSMFAAAAALGTQLTLRGVSESVVVTRPAGKTLEKDNIKEFSRIGGTMVIFLGSEAIGEVMNKVEYPPDTPVAIVFHASWPDQRILKGTVADIAEKAAEAGIDHSALIVIGGVVDAKNFEISRLYS